MYSRHVNHHIYFIGALHINVAPLHHNETTYYLKEEILKSKQNGF